ncbi:ABC transporter ATP-binding protein [Prolixibacter sp. SD074]|uniref:ABC transporter ATP-binding protein n=1 Tax=Prolixibacter sp. SD074 TaxID=2652391 RepID=UPI00126DDE91|nr:ABC transporter ATP-binding protein [Prolixibacter sp. SD074]GET30253.1 ABC transporter ATP-binding protein [Prolixibacter sp. SD074]
MENIIVCKNLTHHYGAKPVFENLNFNVPAGSILGLLGKNGTGKTTTINILNGFLQPTGGQCYIFGEDSQHLSPGTKARIGYLVEGHIQYGFMTIAEIERYYSAYYPGWKKEPYYELMAKLDVAPNQKISAMSTGQRSQVALGLILAQDPELLILDDFSMGLDPGYRRLFIDYLLEYARTGNKTVFTTSHIIQDMEQLIDDVLILDAKQVVAQQPLNDFMQCFRKFTFTTNTKVEDWSNAPAVNVEQLNQYYVELYTWSEEIEVKAFLDKNGILTENFSRGNMNLEDAFIGLTGKY